MEVDINTVNSKQILSFCHFCILESILDLDIYYIWILIIVNSKQKFCHFCILESILDLDIYCSMFYPEAWSKIITVRNFEIYNHILLVLVAGVLVARGCMFVF